MSEDLSQTIAALKVGHRLEDLAVSPTGFAFDPQSGQSFTINPTGAYVLECLRAGCDVDEASREVSSAYAIPLDVARSAVEGFVRQLGRCLQ